jgi:hypothetical protein
VVNKETITRHWIHSFEEDNSEEFVYRPSGFEFPRSRGRRTLDLQAGGKVMDLSPGSTDLPQQIPGVWDIEEDALVIHYTDGKGERLNIKEVSPGKLVIRRS